MRILSTPLSTTQTQDGVLTLSYLGDTTTIRVPETALDTLTDATANGILLDLAQPQDRILWESILANLTTTEHLALTGRLVRLLSGEPLLDEGEYVLGSGGSVPAHYAYLLGEDAA